MLGSRRPGTTTLRVDMGNWQHQIELLQNEGVEVRIRRGSVIARLILPPGWKDMAIYNPERAVFDGQGRKRISYVLRTEEFKHPWVSWCGCIAARRA